MNIKLIIWAVLIFLGIAVIAAVIWYFAFLPHAVPQPIQSSAGLPINGATGSSLQYATPPPAAQAMTMTIASQDGSAVVVNDFIHNNMTIPDAANAGRYLLAGNLGYCLSDQRQCQAAPAENFNVYYNSAIQSFAIALTKEPIGQARAVMEQFLLSTLGITQQQLCSLNYLVSVPSYVNPQFSGKNLGFSFCPGATPLPE
ncbi:MAG: hypothetical protein KGH56_02855 [Patescibacteria group bacterium]|nr:hypothetical protein [Patescibacteria group bacterium]